MEMIDLVEAFFLKEEITNNGVQKCFQLKKKKKNSCISAKLHVLQMTVYCTGSDMYFYHGNTVTLSCWTQHRQEVECRATGFANPHSQETLDTVVFFNESIRFISHVHLRSIPKRTYGRGGAP